LTTPPWGITPHRPLDGRVLAVLAWNPHGAFID